MSYHKKVHSSGWHFTLFILPADKYAVRFIPRENGLHYVHVRLNGNHIPGSPFRVMVGKMDADAGKVRAYGEGLSRGQTGQFEALLLQSWKIISDLTDEKDMHSSGSCIGVVLEYVHSIKLTFTENSFWYLSSCIL